MAYSDTLNGDAQAKLNFDLTTAEGRVAGNRTLALNLLKKFTDGTGSLQATGFFDSTFTATTGGITVSLADSADPLGAAGDDTPTEDPEATKLRVLLIENQDATNYVTLARGTNGEASILSGTTDTVRIDPGGFFLWVSPAGSNAMNDGVDDEIDVQADTASCTVRIAYVFG